MANSPLYGYITCYLFIYQYGHLDCCYEELYTIFNVIVTPSCLLINLFFLNLLMRDFNPLLPPSMHSLADCCMCPYWRSNPKPGCTRTTLQPAELPGQGTRFFMLICVQFSWAYRYGWNRWSIWKCYCIRNFLRNSQNVFRDGYNILYSQLHCIRVPIFHSLMNTCYFMEF